MDDATITTLASGALIFKVQQFFKEQEVYKRFVTAFPGADKWAHRFVAGLFSLIVASGIHYTFDGQCSFANGCHGTFSIPDGWTVLHGIWEWAKVFLIQQGYYDFTRTTKPSSPPSTAHTIDEQPHDQTRSNP